MSECDLTVAEAKGYVREHLPKLGCGDVIHNPLFPRGRCGVCAVRHSLSDGHTGYDTIYVIYKDGIGAIQAVEVYTGLHKTKDYIYITLIEAEANVVTVYYESTGHFTGDRWAASRQFQMKQ